MKLWLRTNKENDFPHFIVVAKFFYVGYCARTNVLELAVGALPMLGIAVCALPISRNYGGLALLVLSIKRPKPPRHIVEAALENQGRSIASN